MTSPTIATVEALDHATCMRLAATASIGRVGLLRRRRPFILPVNFTIDTERDRVVYRTAAGSSLVPYHSAEDVAFEVDGTDDERRLGWSVLIVGRATVLQDQAEIDRLATDLESWAPGSRDVVVVIRAQEVSGRQVVRTRGDRLVEP